MAVLGQPERLIYVAKGLRTGLSDVVAYVQKPTGAVVGPFAMTEFSNPNFAGAYFFDFNTDEVNDTNGTYSWVAVSPTESHRDINKIIYEEISITEISDIIEEVIDVLKSLNQVEAEIEIETEDEIEINVLEN
jgi:hypothetical protein